MDNKILEFSVSDFVAVFNQTINFAYPRVVIVGEVSNFRISRNTWLYFSLVDNESSVSFFGSILKLPAPIEDGMILKITASPQLHPKFGFSMQIQSIELSGEGTINRANKLLETKLRREGLFDPSRKRELPTIPIKIGLITSSESAAYSDFMKILNRRWSGVEINHFDVLVQGAEVAPQIINAITHANTYSPDIEVLVITRGGGSASDLQAFNDENLTRAIAASRIPTLVAIGHERDFTFSEIAADKRASTPSNAAEVIVPDKVSEIIGLKQRRIDIDNYVRKVIDNNIEQISNYKNEIIRLLTTIIYQEFSKFNIKKQLLESLNPSKVLDRGYSIVSLHGKSIRSVTSVDIGDQIDIRFSQGIAVADIIKKR